MDVMTTARKIGLIAADGSDVFGTVERDAVIRVLGELARAHDRDADLFEAAAARVAASRSAGVEKIDTGGFLGRTATNGEIQLSYRAEMAAIFVDLAIDLGLRDAQSSADVS